MMEYPLPWYARASHALLGITLVIALLVVGKELLVPLAFAAVLSVLLSPLSDYLDRHRVPRLLSILLAVGAACIVALSVLAIVAIQIERLAAEFPRLKHDGAVFIGRLQAFIKTNLGINYGDQLRWFEQWWSEVWQRSGEVLSQTLLTFMDITGFMLLVPLFAFLILMYREHITAFFFSFFEGEHEAALNEGLRAASGVLKKYITGLMIETFIVAILNCAALLFLGIDYALLFGILAALLNLIPYVGILIGEALPVLMALITKDSAWYPVGVIASFALIQFIDNNVIIPYIVASRVSINGLVSIIAVFIGGMVWGISGMFLSLPAVAVLKVVFDRVEPLKRWGLLIGDATPPARTAPEL